MTESVLAIVAVPCDMIETDTAKMVDTCHAWRWARAQVPRKPEMTESGRDDALTPSPLAGESKKKKSPLPLGGEGQGEGVIKYQDIPGFCKSATIAEIATHGHVLTPGRYVGAEEIEDDSEAFEEKMPRLVAELRAQFEESAKLEKAIKANLKGLGYGG